MDEEKRGWRDPHNAGWGEPDGAESGKPHGAGAPGLDDPAHRPALSRVSTAASRTSKSSFTAARRSITSRARTVSTAGDPHAMERDRLEVGVIAAALETDFTQTCNLKRGALHRTFRTGFAKMYCIVKYTDVLWGEVTHKTPALRVQDAMEWHTPLHYDFIKMFEAADPMLLTVQLMVKDAGAVSRVGSVTLDLRDDRVGQDQESRWYQLVSDDGVNAPGMILLQVIKGKVGIEEIMKQRRERQLKYMAASLAFAAVLSIVLYLLLAPRFCDAKCRGAWRSEVSMSEARADFAAAVYRDTFVLLGGRSQRSVESWDDTSEPRWRVETSMAETRGRLGAAVLGDRLVAVGGVGRKTAEVFNGSLSADKVLDTSVPFHSLPTMQADLAAVNFRNESLCLVGRSGGSGIVAPSLGASFTYSVNLLCITNGTDRLEHENAVAVARRVCCALESKPASLQGSAATSILIMSVADMLTPAVAFQSGSDWQAKTPVPTDRQKFAVATFNDDIVVIGGWLHGPSAVVSPGSHREPHSSGPVSAFLFLLLVFVLLSCQVWREDLLRVCPASRKIRERRL